MTIVVQKYGGSSVTDVERLFRVADRVVETVRQGHQVVVTVSAMGNTTSELLALARSVSQRPGRRELDLLVSVGERVSMTLLAMAIMDRGVPAASFTGSQSGIITDERHIAARVIEVRPHRIERALSAGKVAIVAGFQGVSRTGEVTTLGRGGTDATAVVLAAALQAEYCEICSDVDGVYTADPRVVPTARRMDTLPLDGAVSLSRMGAKVLQASALEYARQHNITLRANATTKSPGQGTLLPPGPTPDDIVGITVNTRLQRYSLPDLQHIPGALVGSPVQWWSTPDGVEVLINTENLHGSATIPDHWTPLGPIAMVSAVGRSVVTDPTVTRRACAAVPTGTRWWAGGDAWSALIPIAQANDVQRALHDALLSRPGSPLDDH